MSVLLVGITFLAIGAITYAIAGWPCFIGACLMYTLMWWAADRDGVFKK